MLMLKKPVRPVRTSPKILFWMKSFRLADKRGVGRRFGMMSWVLRPVVPSTASLGAKARNGDLMSRTTPPINLPALLSLEGSSRTKCLPAFCRDTLLVLCPCHCLWLFTGTWRGWELPKSQWRKYSRVYFVHDRQTCLRGRLQMPTLAGFISRCQISCGLFAQNQWLSKPQSYGVRKAVRPQRISGSSFDFKVEPRAPLYILPTDFSFNT
jgi:hypothetical protein